MRETDWTELVELRIASAARQHVIALLAFGEKRERRRLSPPFYLSSSSRQIFFVFFTHRVVVFLIPPRVQVGPHRQQQSLMSFHQRLLIRRRQRDVQFSSRRPGSNKWVSLPYISSKLACILKRKAPNYKTHRWRDHVAETHVAPRVCLPLTIKTNKRSDTHPVRFFIIVCANHSCVHMHLDDVVNAPQEIPLLIVYR